MRKTEFFGFPRNQFFAKGHKKRACSPTQLNELDKVIQLMHNRGPKKFSLCLNSKGLREKREDGKGKQW